MIRRVIPLILLVVPSIIAACHAEITAPAAVATPLLDADEPACVDTVYEARSASTGSRQNTSTATATADEPNDGCHIVVIYY